MTRIFLPLLLALSSCKMIIGYREPRALAQADADRQAQRLRIASSTMLDERYSQQLTVRKDSLDTKDYLQPLQCWVYAGDALVWSQVNCYCRFRLTDMSLRWDVADGALRGPSPMDTAGRLSRQQHAALLGLTHASAADTVAFVAWSGFMGRQNRVFLRNVRKFRRGHPGIEIRYVNADNIFVEKK